ncbi:uncharacterized protein SPSC_02052 [Sporisorium scitamineum]|uniref:RNA methyltransferase n=1 Tax=Sporisorium scitamineum TaxID=49012 RepID=A0A0F7RYV8_9BASI|nr:hypothetical protein [Sporisorium scitamineum]CDU23423.1 uncharacterized protein SPSC_02052 [Sporisorium scitamineum]
MRSSDGDGDNDASRIASYGRLADPTAPPIYGNFQRYYHIRNPVNSAANDTTQDVANISSHPALAVDSRVSAILRYLCQHFSASASGEATSGPLKVLDIGCNSGKLTIELAQTLPRLLQQCGQPAGRQLHILGVDIDPSLIGQARQAADAARSRYRPERLEERDRSEHDTDPENVSLPCESVYFPSVFPSLYGSISTENEESRRVKRRKLEDAIDSTPTSALSPLPAQQLCPPNLRFVAADWVQPSPIHHAALLHSDTNGYDITLALSITKWIHIQQGDVGLVRCFARIATTLHSNGLLFLERQEWPSYHSAKNLDPTIRAKIKRLQLRPGGDFDWWLDTFGLELVGEIGYGVGVGFSRPLQVFRKESTTREEKLAAEQLATTAAAEGMQPFPWVARSSCSVTPRAALTV